MTPIEIKVRENSCPLKVKQYPISTEWRRGLRPVTETFMKDGLLEPCMSPYNTHILLVKKSDGTY